MPGAGLHEEEKSKARPAPCTCCLQLLRQTTLLPRRRGKQTKASPKRGAPWDLVTSGASPFAHFLRLARGVTPSTRKIQALWRGAFHRRHVWPALRKKLLQNKSIGKDRELERAMQRLLEIRMEEFIPQKRDMVNKACNHLQILSITDGSPFARHAWWNVKRLDGLASPTSSITDTDSTPSPRSVTEIVETEYKEALFGRRLAERVADDRNVKPDPPQGTDQLQGKWTLPLTCSVFRAHSVALRQTKTVSDCVKVNDWLTNLRAYDRLELLPVRRPRHRVQDRASQPQNPPVEEVPSTPGEAESSPPDSVTSSALDLYFGPQLSRRRRLLHRTDAASLAKARPYYPPPTRLEIPENGPQHAGDQSADPGATGRSTASTVSTASQANSSFPPVARPCTVPAGRLFRSGVADNKSSVGNGSGKAGASFPAVAGGRGKDVLAPVMALRQTGWGMLLLEEAVAENIPSDEAQAREAGFGTACGNVVFPARTRTAHDKLHATPIHQLRKANKAGLSVHHKTRRPQWVG
ncbi:hypothetical protein DIPPA_14519 [Diplonema papillatum]|nr:hypothetical protein DIPPA_14519 [Diplonema papillatum]